MSESQSQLTVELEQITYQNTENAWTVARARDVKTLQPVTIVGSFSQITVGEHWMIWGMWKDHSKFGRQFVVQRAVETRPVNKGAIKRYLSCGLYKGIGRKTADRIVDFFGEKTLDVLDQNPEQLQLVPKLGKKTSAKIIHSWEEKKQVTDIMLFLTHHQLSMNKAKKIFKKYGEFTVERLSENPYRLIADFSGIGFLTADRIAQSMNIDKQSPHRIAEGFLFQLGLASDEGHCYQTTQQITPALAKILELEEQQIIDLLPNVLETLQNNLRVISSEGATPQSTHYLTALLTAESSLALNLKRILSLKLSTPQDPKENHHRIEAWLEKYSATRDLQLSEEQSEAVIKAATSKVFILTGGPGVGKTTTANTLIQLLKAMGKSIALAAPTGRAAQRMQEVSSFKATTIHRLLEWSPVEGRFMKDQDNPIQKQVIIIDETSMLDVKLADSLCQATMTNSQLILIGDIDQLPSVGPGHVLRDLINSGNIPYSQLKTVFRQAASSKIIQYSHDINQGKCPQFSQETSDCSFIEQDQPQNILRAIEDLCSIHLPRSGYNWKHDIQILTPMNKGPLGATQINKNLQALLNPQQPNQREWKHGDHLLRAGDRVIQTTNNYELGVFNGDIGFISEVGVEGGKLLVSFQDKEIAYDDMSAKELSLAYAITIHKSQGSEFKVVILPISLQHFVMLQRNLIYTGLTRARKLAVFVGHKKALKLAAKQESSAKRQTQLAQRLNQLITTT